jgi:membrane protein DedA with SNARE-associated domain
VEVEMLQGFVEHFTYLGIFAVLLLGSLGVPIPKMLIIAAAVLSHEGLVRWWLALFGQLASGPAGTDTRARAVVQGGRIDGTP